MTKPESSPEGRQYGLPFHGEETLFSVAKKIKDGETYFRADTKRTEVPSKPGQLPKPDLTNHSQLILERKYLLRDERGNVVETPEELFWRVAYNVGTADLFYGEDPSKSRENFYLLMANRYFCPNSPTLMNAGAKLQQLSGCFAIPIKDSMEFILEAHNIMTWVHKTGGGTGFNFSNLRPKDSLLSTGGVTSGPVSFMEGLFDATTETVKQGGKRRGANMGILEAWHPDIREFITAKLEEEKLTNFNISVGASDEFMRAAKEGREWELVNPHTGERKKDDAREIFQLIVETAHASGGPGLVFLDRINKANPTPGLGEIETTNPCGEQPLLPYESCNLGSINLALMVEDGGIKWGRLGEVVKTAVHFLDNVVDMNEFPDAKIEEATLKTRKIGLGVMGFADMLAALDIKYDSEEAVEVAEKVMGFIRKKSHDASEELARKRGPFPAYKGSIYDQEENQERRLMRNAAVTTIAPTGTISLIMGCLSGIEPLFGFRIIRKDTFTPKGEYIINPRFEEMIRELGLSEEAKERIAKQNSLEGIDEIPEDWKRTLRTAHDVSPEWHIRIQAAFQKHLDSAVSKTINMPREATIEDVWKAYMLAWELDCKGITIYRYGSKEKQVLSLEEKERIKRQPRPRPEETEGVTVKIPLGCGQTMYLTVNKDAVGLCETFVQMGKSGGCIASQQEALGRVISLALRSGVETPAIVRQLRGIRCPSPRWEKGKRIYSCADAIAQELEKQGSVEEGLLSGEPAGMTLLISDSSPIIGKGEEIETKNILGFPPECPDCGAMFEYSEGCAHCPACGFGTCG